MSLALIIHNFLFVFGGVTNICLAIFVLYVNRKNITSTSISFVLMTLSVANFQISHVLGIMAKDAETSRLIFMFNLGDILITVFMTHWFLALTGKVKQKSREIILGSIYIISALMLTYFILVPQAFLLSSVPKLYFPFYYNPGKGYILMVLWFLIIGGYYFYELLTAYLQAEDPVQKNRLKYVLFSIGYAFVFGTSAFLLVFNIPLSPIWASLFGLYTLPLAYAMVRYELLDIRILAKRAFLYASIILLVGVLVMATNIFTNYLHMLYPAFPDWINSVILSILIGGLGIFVYVKARESDMLKYEFVTIITHKFRTPISKITWTLDITEKIPHLPPEAQSDLKTIRGATLELLELTNIIVLLNETETQYIYHFKNVSLNTMMQDLINEASVSFKEKGITLDTDMTKESLMINVDSDKVKVALQNFIQNALVYTPQGGKVHIHTKQMGNTAVCKITDTGIGIAQFDRQNIFKKFYRAHNARTVHTEGSGIGLYISKTILERNGAKITVESEGEGKGTTFSIIFTLKK